MTVSFIVVWKRERDLLKYSITLMSFFLEFDELLNEFGSSVYFRVIFIAHLLNKGY
jgi:hypothetical protein